MVSDAHTTAAAIANYYSNTEHITLPTVDQLMKGEDLSTYFPVSIKADSNGDPFITVIDDNAECIKGKKFVYYYNGMDPEWKD